MAGLVIGNFSYHTLSEGNGQIQPVFPQALHHGASTLRIIFPLYINTCFFKRRISHSLVMNMRSYFGCNRRAQAVSKDGGITWTGPEDVPDLIEPVCQASVVRYSWPEQNQESILVFSNPAATSREKWLQDDKINDNP